MDKYDKEIERLKRTPQNINASWLTWGSLFQYATPTGKPQSRPDGGLCGCLTTVKSGMEVAWTDDLTRAIRNDKRLPSLASEIKPKHLHIFAEWQRRIDKELNRQ